MLLYDARQSILSNDLKDRDGRSEPTLHLILHTHIIAGSPMSVTMQASIPITPSAVCPVMTHRGLAVQ